jgi:uncharacterized metal-binding protein YceD (DUF177 family)
LHHFFLSAKLRFENQYIIHFKGLKEGVHRFEFEIKKPFFEEYTHLDVPDGNITVRVLLTKKVSFMDLTIDLEGEMLVQCDRCLEYFNLPVPFSGHLVVRFSETEKEPDDEVIFLHPEDSELDLKHYLYECISLTIPMRKVHPELPGGKTGCDPEMLRRLKEHLIRE